MATLIAFPASLIAGDTLLVARTYDEEGVAVGASWAVTLTLLTISGQKVEVTAVESSGTFLFTLTATASAGLPAGYTSYAVTAVKNGIRVTVEQGSLTVKPDPTNALSGDASEMAHVERVIAACKARLEGKVTDDVQMYQLPDGITVSRMTLRDVRELLVQYQVKRQRMLTRGRPRVREVWYGLR